MADGVVDLLRETLHNHRLMVASAKTGRPDLTTPDGFHDDLAELRRLLAFLGYV